MVCWGCPNRYEGSWWTKLNFKDLTTWKLYQIASSALSCFRLIITAQQRPTLTSQWIYTIVMAVFYRFDMFKVWAEEINLDLIKKKAWAIFHNLDMKVFKQRTEEIYNFALKNDVSKIWYYIYENNLKREVRWSFHFASTAREWLFVFVFAKH